MLLHRIVDGRLYRPIGRPKLSKIRSRPMRPCYEYGPVWPRRRSRRVFSGRRCARRSTIAQRGSQGPPPRARIDNSPPPVCTRSVRLSIGHQGTMKHRSPLSNLTPSRYALRVQRLPWRPIPGHEPNADPGYNIVKRIRFYTVV